MPKGDHLTVSRGTYSHHALDLGDGRVMQYGSRPGEKSARVEVVDKETFSQGSVARVVGKTTPYSPDEIVARAWSRVGEQNYSLIWDNCEHFVNWCRIGKGESRQVDRVSEGIASSLTKLAANYFIKTAFRSSAKVTVKTMTRGVTPWLLVADGVQFATELATAHMGAGEKDAETAGQIVGAGTSVGIGAAVAGPIGAMVGVGLWAAGETVGKEVSCRVLEGLGKNRSRPAHMTPRDKE